MKLGTFISKKEPLAAIYLMVLLLVACAEREEVKSIQYYKQHIEEALTVERKCKQKRENELSKMSPSQRLAWKETTEGINCMNSSEAIADKKWNDHQESMRKTLDKYE